MTTVSVHVSTPYSVHIERGLLTHAGQYIAHTFGTPRVMIVTDDTVAELYLDSLTASLDAVGIRHAHFVIPHGEASKNMTSLTSLLERLAEEAFTRSDILVALGGGVVGDLTGFAAAVYLRGIRYAGIPTTVLAAVDSSVGGKTAVDLGAGKNLAGAFWHPSLVLCDPDTLSSLPEDIFADGMAEVIKYGMLGDAELLAILDGTPDMESVIARCVQAKADIVEQDEHDIGLRQLLNYGHTAGHAIEANSDFTILHGHGVAMGMMIALRFAVKEGICPPDVPIRLARLLKKYHLPTDSPYGAEKLITAAARDKKRRGGHIDLVLPTKWGKCEIRRYPVEALADFLKRGIGADRVFTFRTPIMGGTVAAIPSKSAAHRMLICAALSDGPTFVRCAGRCEDIDATIRCLTALGAQITQKKDGFTVTPIARVEKNATLDCGESGSTLRFLLPIVGALGAEADMIRHGRLASRPLSPLYEEMMAHGAILPTDPTLDPLHVGGQLHSGDYTLAAGVSSQFISGLLMAFPILGAGTTLTLCGDVVSKEYIRITTDVMTRFGAAPVMSDDGRRYAATMAYHTPGEIMVEGDWSGAALWLVAGAIGQSPLTITGLTPDSPQGDRRIAEILAEMGADVRWNGDTVTVTPAPLHGIEIDASGIPDLVPILAVAAAAAQGKTILTGTARLRIKESDRSAAITEMLMALGGEIVEEEDRICIQGGRPLHGGIVSSHADHRMVMCAAALSLLADSAISVTGGQSVAKSYPGFAEDYVMLGGEMEQEEA